jgi:hypothetical protein
VKSRLPLVAAGIGAAVVVVFLVVNNNQHTTSTVSPAVSTTAVQTPTVQPPRPVASPSPSQTAIGFAVAAYLGADNVWIARWPEGCFGFVTRCSSLSYSADNGKSWAPRTMPAPLCVAEELTCHEISVDNFRFATETIGYAYSYTNGDVLYMTKDGGRTWDRQPGGATWVEPLNGNVMRLLATDTRCLSGCGVHLELAKVGSTRWTRVTLPVSGKVFGAQSRVELYRAGHGAYVWLTREGQPAALFSSADDGRTWTMQRDPCTSLGAYSQAGTAPAPDGSLTLLCWSPHSVVIMTSTDDAQTWTHGPTIDKAGGPAFLGIISATVRNTFALGGYVVRSTDLGAHWTFPHGASIDNADYCAFQTTTVGHCLTQDGKRLLTTANAGVTWRARAIGG